MIVVKVILNGYDYSQCNKHFKSLGMIRFSQITCQMDWLVYNAFNEFTVN